jgi:hypothetical protein
LRSEDIIFIQYHALEFIITIDCQNFAEAQIEKSPIKVSAQYSSIFILKVSSKNIEKCRSWDGSGACF